MKKVVECLEALFNEAYKKHVTPDAEHMALRGKDVALSLALIFFILGEKEASLMAESFGVVEEDEFTRATPKDDDDVPTDDEHVSTDPIIDDVPEYEPQEILPEDAGDLDDILTDLA